MRLIEKIGHLVRARLHGAEVSAAWSPTGRNASPQSGVAGIRRSLEESQSRRARLEEALDDSLREGREGDTVRLKRQLAELERSQGELQAALELIQSQQEQTSAAKRPATDPGVETAKNAESLPQAAGEHQDSARDQRKSRLSRPE